MLLDVFTGPMKVSPSPSSKETNMGEMQVASIPPMLVSLLLGDGDTFIAPVMLS